MWFSEWLRSLVFNPKNYFPFHLSQHVKNKSCSCLWNRSVPSENSALDIVAHLDLLLDNLLWVALLWAGAWTRWPPEVAADLSHSEFTGDKWLFADCVFILDIVVCFFFFQFWGREGKVWFISATCFTKLLRVCGNRKNSTLNSGPSWDFTEDFCSLFCYKLSALLLCSSLVGCALKCTHKPVKLLLKEIWKKRVARAVLCLCEEAAHQPEASHRLEKACQFCVIFILIQIAH